MVIAAEPASTRRRGQADLTSRRSVPLLLVTLLMTAMTLVLGYANKARCVGPEFDVFGQSGPDLALRDSRDVCYSDIQYLWSGRELYLHRFPYLHGAYDPVTRQISGGTLEYPVLTGLTTYVTSLFASDDGQFLLVNAILLSICGLICAFVLSRLAGIRAWWFALAPPIVLYAFHNWDLLAVLSVVAVFGVLSLVPRSAHPGRLLLIAAALLGIGGAIKFYPLMFAVPVACWAALRDRPPGLPATDASGHAPWRGARWGFAVLGVAAGVFALVNAPFMIAGFRGWWASFQFQWSRPIDITTNSIWFWATRPDGNPDNLTLQNKLGQLSALATAVGLLVVVLGGFFRRRAGGTYPWLQVSAAMLAVYLVLNKVNSPQYALWLLPFFVLLRLRAGWILSFFVADACIGIGFFRWQYQLLTNEPSGVYDSFVLQAVMIGVWGRAALLLGMAVAFLGAESMLEERTEADDGRPRGKMRPPALPALPDRSALPAEPPVAAAVRPIGPV